MIFSVITFSEFLFWVQFSTEIIEKKNELYTKNATLSSIKCFPQINDIFYELIIILHNKDIQVREKDGLCGFKYDKNLKTPKRTILAKCFPNELRKKLFTALM